MFGRFNRRAVLTVLHGALLPGLWLACSPSTGANGAGAGPLGGGAGAGTGGVTASGAGGSVTGGGSGSSGEPVVPIFNTPDAGAQGGDGGLPPDKCGATTLRAETATETRIETHTEIRTETHTETRTETHTELEPVAIYIMQDQSGSMVDKWGFASQAITSFVNDPASQGLDVAIHYFPLSGPFCIPVPGGDCMGAVYATPEVPFGRLDATGAQAQAIVNNLGTHGPCGAGTPIEPALRGVTQACLAFEAAHPGEDCVALFITDGAPSTCDLTAAGLSAIAADAFSKGVSTFTVGMPGADFTMLDQIAQAGGTDCDPTSARRACNASSVTEFNAALAAIRESVTTTTEVQVQVEVPVEVQVEVPVQVEISVPLPCEWPMPTSRTSETIDVNTLNVQVTNMDTSEKISLGMVPSAAECPSYQNGWYYDDPANPTRIHACADSCTLIEGIPAQIDILVGCESIPAVLR